MTKKGPYKNQYSCKHAGSPATLNRARIRHCVNTNLVYQYQALIRLRHKSLDIRFDNESQIDSPKFEVYRIIIFNFGSYSNYKVFSPDNSIKLLTFLVFLRVSYTSSEVAVTAR